MNLTNTSTGQDYANWFLSKNPVVAKADAIAFALFQCEMALLIRAKSRYHQLQTLRNFKVSSADMGGQIRQLQITQKIFESIELDNSDQQFLDRYFHYRHSKQYNTYKDMHDRERHQRARYAEVQGFKK